MQEAAIDVFAHVLPPNFYQQMLSLEPSLPKKYPFITHPLLSDMDLRQKHFDGQTKQVISNVNVNPEDYTDPKQASLLCQQGNNEIVELVKKYPDMFYGAVAMLPLNAPEKWEDFFDDVKQTKELLGIQLFTRALGKSIADSAFEKVFELAAKKDVILWLHPVFDERKPDNNIVFSWEYELTQAMFQLVTSGIFEKWPHLKIIVHHAGGMVPYFAGRIEHILPKEQVQAFKKFYVDTAILGNEKALELAVDYYGSDHVLFGTDAPLGIAPAGATEVIRKALENTCLTKEQQVQILNKNFEVMVGDLK